MPNRRTLLRNSAAAAVTLNFGGWLATPREAAAANYNLQILSPKEASLVAALGEVLMPGSKEAGLTHYLDQQLAAPREQSLLMIQYLGVEAPFTDFYRAGLSALANVSVAAHGQRFESLSSNQQIDLVKAMSADNPEGWAGPPAPFFYFVLRSDAVDVVYGDPEGLRDLDIPSMAHIAPPDAPWRSTD